jgi:asparagine synthetase B (glutamine-hydrolysing)
MALIAGSITYPDSGSARITVEKALSSMDRTGQGTSTLVDLPGCSMGLLTFPHEQGSEKMRVARHGNTVLMCWGYIKEMEQVQRRLVNSGAVFDESVTNAEILLESYFRIGVESLQGLNGLYGIVIWDDREKSFYALTDRGGFTWIYYWQGSDGLVFGSECRAILSHSEYRKSIDMEGVVNFLGAGYCFEDRTLFQGIKMIPQGSRLAYKDGKLELKKYWDYSVRPVEGNLEEYSERFFSLLNESFQQCVRGVNKVFIPLSGGLDSRTMAGLAASNGIEIHSCTTGHPGFRDFRYGRKLGEKISTNHTILPIGNNFLKKYGASGVERTEGAVVINVFYLAQLYEWTGSADVLVSGFLGDTLTGLSLTRRTGNAEEAIKSTFLQSFDFEELTSILAPALRPLSELNSLYLNESLSKAMAESMCDKRLIVNLRERQRRHTCYFLPALGSKWNVVAPFSDNNVIDFILTVPTRFRDKQIMYKKMICEKLPAMASVPESHTGRRLQSTWWSWRWESLKSRMPSVIMQNSLRLRNRIADSRLMRKLGQGNAFHVIDIDNAMRTGSADYLQDLLSDKERMLNIFNIDKVEELRSAHMAGHIYDNSRLCKIATIVQWRRQFGL